MKRVKKVHNTDQLMHLFCHIPNADLEGFKNSSGNVFFTNGKLYSYGYHYIMAIKTSVGTGTNYKELVFINADGYSNTTQKQQSRLRRAVKPTQTMIHVYDMEDIKSEDNLIKLQKDLQDSIDYIKNPRTPGFNGDITQVERNQDILELFCKFSKRKFKPLKELELKDLKDLASLKDQKRAYRDELKQMKKQRKDAEKAKEYQEQAGLWLKGLETIQYIPWHLFHLKHALIRIKGNRVETSLGAEVPLTPAKILAKRLAEGQDLTGSKIGAFQIDSIEGDEIKAGCHTLSKKQVLEVLLGKTY